jgi:hypothetical protein
MVGTTQTGDSNVRNDKVKVKRNFERSSGGPSFCVPYSAQEIRLPASGARPEYWRANGAKM